MYVCSVASYIYIRTYMHVFIYEYFTGCYCWCLICWHLICWCIFCWIIIIVIVIIVIVHTPGGVTLRYYYEGENVSHYILVTYVHSYVLVYYNWSINLYCGTFRSTKLISNTIYQYAKIIFMFST